MSSVQKFMRSISIRKAKKPKTAKKSNSTSGASARTFANFHQEFQQQQESQQQQQQLFQLYQQQEFQDYQQQNIPTTTPTALGPTTNGYEYNNNNNNNNKIYRPAPKLFIPPPPVEDFYNCGVEPIEDNWSVEYITLYRQGRGLGLMVSGGVDQPADNGDTSFYVSQIVEGSVAELDGRLQLNDMIVSVNGTVFQGLTHREAVEFLVMSGETVSMVVRRPPPPAPPAPEPEPMLTVSETIVQIHLFKGNQGLGFTVSGGVDEPIYEGDNGIFVTQIVSGGLADQDGRLTVGDRLIAVNDINLCHVRHEVAVATLKSSRDLVRLLVGKPSSPAGLPVTTSVSNMEPIDRSTPESARLAFTQSQPTLSCREAEPLNGINIDQPITQPNSPQRFQALQQQSAGRPTAAVSVGNLPELVPRIITDNREAAGFVKEPREIVLRKKLDQGLGFNIVGGKDGHGIFVSSIVPGGIADVTGEIRRGDQLLRVNGVDLRDATHEEAVIALKTVRKRAKIVAQYRPQEFAHFERKVRDQSTRSTSQIATNSGPAAAAQPRTIFIRALFDFEPSKERSMPSKGLVFSFGDILHVVRPAAAAAAGDAAADDDDDEWWNARRVVPWSETDSAGLIPSKTRVERRKSHKFRNIKTLLRTESELREMLNGDKKRRSFTLSKKLAINKSKDTATDGTANGNTEFVYEPGSIHSYEPVVQLQVRYTRPVVIIGPLKDYIYDELMGEFPDKFGGCVPHTSRPKRPGELDGIDYHFVSSRDQMEQETRKPGGQYVEVGVYNGHLYGLTANSIKAVAMQGKHCILDVTVEAIARLQSVDLYPIAILVKPATPTIMTTWDKPASAEDSKTTFNSAQKLLNDFSKFFTAVVNAESLVQVYASVKQIIQEQSQSIIWVSSGDTL